MDPLRSDDPARIGRYRLQGRLGAGGMGVVYLGRSPGGRLVAVKCLHRQLAADLQFRRRFAQELDAARRVGGFHTAQVVDADPDGDPPWLVAAYIPGPSLADALAAHGPLPEPTLRVLGAGLAEALEAIHAAGLVHRDLKPSNILLADDGPRVIDFGIARALDGTSLTNTSLVVGTPGFMAPEQLVGGAALGPACDVFCLGQVICHAAGGEPFGSGAAQALMYRVVHEEPDLHAVPASLRDVVARCLAKDPTSRPTPSALLGAFGGAEATGPWLPPAVWSMVLQRASVHTAPSESTARAEALTADPTEPAAIEAIPAEAVTGGVETAAAQTGPAGSIEHAEPPEPEDTAPGDPAPARDASLAPPVVIEPTWDAVTVTAPVPKRRPRLLALIVAAALTATAAAAGTYYSLKGAPAPKAAASTSMASGGPPVIDTVDSGTPRHGGQIGVALGAQVVSWNVNDYSATPDTRMIMNGVLESAYTANPDGTLTLNSDLLTSVRMTARSPQTLIYTFNPKAVWNDGTPLGLDDMVYTWLSENGSVSSIPVAFTSGYRDIASITASGSAITVTWKQGKTYPDWRELFAPILPASFAKAHGWSKDTYSTSGGTVKSDDPGGLAASWTAFGATTPTYSDGPYEISSSTGGHTTVLGPNPAWYGTKGPYLDKITFQTITDSAAQVAALRSGEVDVIDPQPSASLMTGQINGLPSAGFTHQLGPGTTWEHLDFNMANPAFGGTTSTGQQAPTAKALRQAIFTAVDRATIVAHALGPYDPSAKPLGNATFTSAQAGYADDVTAAGLGGGNVAKAQAILRQAGYTGVGTSLVGPDGKAVAHFKLVYSDTHPERLAECQTIARDLAKLGIGVDLSATDDLNKSLQHSDPGRDYDLIVYAWVDTVFPDQNDAYDFHSAPAGASSSVSGDFGSYSDPLVDSLLADAATALDPGAQLGELTQADKLIINDAYVLPLFRWDSLLVADSKLVNVRDNTTSSSPTYNIAQWGFKQ